jgi:LPXTG-motif cell wall-anchored protein
MGITDSWWFYIVMVLILAGLIGAFFYLRNKQSED